MIGIEVALNAGHNLMIYMKDSQLTAQMGAPEETPREVISHLDPDSLLQNMSLACLKYLPEKVADTGHDFGDLLNPLPRLLQDGTLFCHQARGRFHCVLTGTEDVLVPQGLFQEVEEDGEPRFWTDERGVLFGVAKNNDGDIQAAVLGKPEDVSNPWEKTMHYRGSGKSFVDSLKSLFRGMEPPLPS